VADDTDFGGVGGVELTTAREQRSYQPWYLVWGNFPLIGGK